MSEIPFYAWQGLTVAVLLGWTLLLTRARVFSRRRVLTALAVSISGPLLLVLLEAVRWLELPWVRFSRPLACLPVFVTQAWILLRLRGYGARTSAARRRAFESSVGAAVALAGLAVSGLEIGHAVDRLTILIALDRSRSIELVPGAETRIERELAVAELGMRPSDRIGTVAFAADARIEDPVRPKSTLRGAQRVDIARDGTDISQAIRQALSSIPPDSAARIAILSDGVATRGDTLEAALAASALGVPIDVVALDQGSPKDVRVVSVRVPPHGAKGETLDVRIVTHASQQTRVTIRLLRDGDLIREGPATLAQGEDVVTLREIAPEPGLHRYDVELSVEDRSVDRAPEDNSGSAFMRVRGESTALVLDSDPAFGAATAQALRNAAFLVDTAGPTGIPADLAGLARYDLIVLGDISAPEFSPQQLLAMQSYVRDLGGGLLLLGGDKTMGPGGFARTPIEEVSPVSFDLKQERRRASLAEVIAIDYSGSMAATVDGRTKLELANEAAARSSELLGEGDRLGVMHVDTAVSWTLPLANVTDTAEIGNRIRRVGPGGGGIFIDLSLSAAYQALARESVQLKHLLLFSDGGDAEERARAPGLVERAREKGITTSVVALGNGSDVPALSRMAELGGGRFYLIEDAARLPAVFAQETVLATRSAIHEVAFVPHPLSPSRVLSGVSLQQAPPLKGYVVTLPKPRAQVLLAGPEADPILATWSVGVGRAGAFTSDYKDRWGSEWLGWPAAARLFAQLGRDLGRRLDDPKVRFEASTQNGELTLQASVVDEQGRHASFRQLTARVAGPDGHTREVNLEPTGAGQYIAHLPVNQPGSYLASLLDDSAQSLGTTGAVLSRGDELRPTGTDRALLRRISELSSGKVRDTLAGIFNDRDARRFAYDALSGWLAAMAALCLLGSVAIRRIHLPPLRWPGREHTAAKPGTYAGNSDSAAYANQGLEALRAVRERLRARAPMAADAQAAGGAPTASKGENDTLLTAAPKETTPARFVLGPEAPAARSSMPESPGTSQANEPVTPSVAHAAPAPTPSPTRTKSAAEILLERRRARR